METASPMILILRKYIISSTRFLGVIFIIANIIRMLNTKFKTRIKVGIKMGMRRTRSRLRLHLSRLLWRIRRILPRRWALLHRSLGRSRVRRRDFLTRALVSVLEWWYPLVHSDRGRGVFHHVCTPFLTWLVVWRQCFDDRMHRPIPRRCIDESFAGIGCLWFGSIEITDAPYWNVCLFFRRERTQLASYVICVVCIVL